MTVRIRLNGADHEVTGSPSVTLLDYLRDTLHLTGTKEGCAEGDCGACTVVRVVAGDGQPRYEAVNACLMQVGQADGCEILTVEGLTGIHPAGLTPIQDAMASGGGTQCGFCTPGFVCALFALAQSGEKPDDDIIHEALAGNLCRCTGYRPIVDAARTACRTVVPREVPAVPPRSRRHESDGTRFLSPGSLAELLELRACCPDAMLLAGGTDLGLRINKERERPEVVIHTAHVSELCQIRETDDGIEIGAAVTYTQALPVLDRLFPSLGKLLRRIGSRQIRNLGTLGGNLGTASPIGDTLPSFLVLEGVVQLASASERREVPIERFFLGYRETDLRADEVITAIRLPKPAPDTVFRTYKISKRLDQDISAVIGAFCLRLDGQRIRNARVAYGGMAGIPARSPAAEACLTGAVWSKELAGEAASALESDFTPISDHRAGARYRSRVAANLLTRFWLESEGTGQELEVIAL